MNAFIEAIKRIDEVNIDEQYKETFCNVMKQFAKFFENNNIELDVEQIFESKLYTGLEICQIEKDLIAKGVKPDGCFYLEDNAIALPPLNSGYDIEHILAHEFTHFLIMNTYPKLPDWANEMMTELSARIITNSDLNDFGQYQALINLAQYVDSNILPFGKNKHLDCSLFWNGNFNQYIDKLKLNKIQDELNQMTFSESDTEANKIFYKKIYPYLLKTAIEKFDFSNGINISNFDKFISLIDINLVGNPNFRLEQHKNIEFIINLISNKNDNKNLDNLLSSYLAIFYTEKVFDTKIKNVYKIEQSKYCDYLLFDGTQHYFVSDYHDSLSINRFISNRNKIIFRNNSERIGLGLSQDDNGRLILSRNDIEKYNIEDVNIDNLKSQIIKNINDSTKNKKINLEKN